MKKGKSFLKNSVLFVCMMFALVACTSEATLTVENGSSINAYELSIDGEDATLYPSGSHDFDLEWSGTDSKDVLLQGSIITLEDGDHEYKTIY